MLSSQNHFTRQSKTLTPEEYLKEKYRGFLHHYSSRNAAVVGYSGGVDSALTIAMLLWFTKQPDSPLKMIHALGLNAKDSTKGKEFYQTNPDKCEEAIYRLKKDFSTYGTLYISNYDLSSALDTICENIAGHLTKNQFIGIQAIPMLRQTYLYAKAAQLVSLKERPLVVGTINYPEYHLGFFGKASEGACDAYLITDLHKSDVRRLARYLGVPESICSKPASGDVPGYSTTEQMMGFTYEEFEEYSSYYARSQPTHHLHSSVKRHTDKNYHKRDRIAYESLSLGSPVCISW